MSIRSVFVVLLTVSLVLMGCSKEEAGEDGHKHSEQEKHEYYTCPMHPQVVSDKPGSCPICGMDLVKKTAAAADMPKEQMKEMLTLGQGKQALAGVSTVKVQRENLSAGVTAYSYMDIPEQNRHTVTARFNGRIERLYVDRTGQNIRRGQSLFEIYSPDIVQAQNDYLIASGGPVQAAARKKLELLGVTASQIAELEKSGEVKYTITYHSPVSGTIIEKRVQSGMYVNEGTVLYEAADLSTLWNIAEVYENNLSSIKPGSSVSLRLRAYPGEVFNGRVTFIYPVLDPQTRTIRVRSEFRNSGGRLKPQMYGEATFNSPSVNGLFVPQDAVLFTGKRNIIWVKTPDGMFEPRDVQVGGRFGDRYQILSGLKEGDEAAITGGFLIDSESQLSGNAQTGHEQHK